MKSVVLEFSKLGFARWTGAVLFFALVLSFTGCTVTPKSPLTTEVERTRQQALYNLKYWRAEGRLGVRSPDGAWNANLFWEHDGDQDRLRISGPFSQGVVSIILQNDLIYINEGNGLVEMTRSPREALKRRLGFEVPVESLRFWILGLPLPGGEPARPMRESSTLRSFVQQGWQLDFDRFTPLAGGEVPQKISLRGNQVRLKLIIDSWVSTPIS